MNFDPWPHWYHLCYLDSHQESMTVLVIVLWVAVMAMAVIFGSRGAKR